MRYRRCEYACFYYNRISKAKKIQYYFGWYAWCSVFPYYFNRYAKIMTDEAKNVLNYTFPDLLNSTIWNNMTMFFPMIIALIGGYMINREYTDDTLKICKLFLFLFLN